MRTHAGNCNMLLNSHFLMRQTPQGVKQVPEEVPPLDADGREFWPPAWQESGKRSVEKERDVFDLLKIRWLEPAQRNCP